MKEICGMNCGWHGAEIVPSQKNIVRLADRVAAEIVAGRLEPGRDVVPSGVCPWCEALTYPELPDQGTVACCRYRLARIYLAGRDPVGSPGNPRPGQKAPGSIGRTLKRAMNRAEMLGCDLVKLSSMWLDWKHPNGARPDWNPENGRRP
jgi:hypothetical protein